MQRLSRGSRCSRPRAVLARDVIELEGTGFDPRVALEEATQQEAARSEQATTLGSLTEMTEMMCSLGGPRAPRDRVRAHDDGRP